MRTIIHDLNGKILPNTIKLFSVPIKSDTEIESWNDAISWSIDKRSRGCLLSICYERKNLEVLDVTIRIDLRTNRLRIE